VLPVERKARELRNIDISTRDFRLLVQTKVPIVKRSRRRIAMAGVIPELRSFYPAGETGGSSAIKT
jgi:hypothetical protein